MVPLQTHPPPGSYCLSMHPYNTKATEIRSATGMEDPINRQQANIGSGKHKVIRTLLFAWPPHQFLRLKNASLIMPCHPIIQANLHDCTRVQTHICRVSTTHFIPNSVAIGISPSGIFQ